MEEENEQDKQENEILKRGTEVQERMHKFIDAFYKAHPDTNITYENVTNVMLMNEIAQLELRIEKLENRPKWKF